MKQLSQKRSENKLPKQLKKEREKINKSAQTVIDRKTGEAYDPKARFDEMMQKDEIQAVFKRMVGK